VLTPEGVSRVEAAVERCEDWQSVDELARSPLAQRATPRQAHRLWVVM